MQLNIVIIFVAITFISPALALSNNIGSQMSKTADNSAMIPGVVSTLHGQRAKTYWFHEDETADTSSLKRKKLHPSHLLHPLKFLGNLSHKLSSTFMPLGYPTRTPPGYLLLRKYNRYSTCRRTASPTDECRKMSVPIDTLSHKLIRRSDMRVSWLWPLCDVRRYVSHKLCTKESARTKKQLRKNKQSRKTHLN